MSNINTSSSLRPVSRPTQTPSSPPPTPAAKPERAAVELSTEAVPPSHQLQLQTATESKPVTKAFRFVSEDLFSGYHSAAVRDPGTPLQVASPPTYTPPAGTSFNDFVASMDTPDKVAAFGRHFWQYAL